MKNLLIMAVIAAAFLTSCSNTDAKFSIKKGSVGPVTENTKISELDALFEQDSLVPLTRINNALGTQGEVEVYEKGGTLLMLVSPDDEEDPNAVITNVRIYDERFKTDKGLHLKSTFKTVRENYKIAGIQTSFDAVVVFLEDSDVYLTIDKKQLPENLRYDPSINIEASQIPDQATFKYFMVAWDGNDE